MCYLIAKKFEDKGCIAVKTKHGKELAEFASSLEKKVDGAGIQIVTISRPSAYGEYEPYAFAEDFPAFEKQVLMM